MSDNPAAALIEIDRLKAERDAAFAMSRCECGPDECCANLVRLHKEIANLREYCRQCDVSAADAAITKEAK